MEMIINNDVYHMHMQHMQRYIDKVCEQKQGVKEFRVMYSGN